MPPLRRPRYEMPEFIRQALADHGLVEAYRLRPPYQQNDYIGWITRAKREPTRQKRLAEMLDDLSRGNRYMGMAYPAKSGIPLVGRADQSKE